MRYLQAVAIVRLFVYTRGGCVDLEGVSGLPSLQMHSRPDSSRDSQRSARFPLVVDGHVVCKLPKTEFKHWYESLRQAKVLAEEGFRPHWELVGFDRERCGFLRATKWKAFCAPNCPLFQRFVESKIKPLFECSLLVCAAASLKAFLFLQCQGALFAQSNTLPAAGAKGVAWRTSLGGALKKGLFGSAFLSAWASAQGGIRGASAAAVDVNRDAVVKRVYESRRTEGPPSCR